MPGNAIIQSENVKVIEVIDGDTFDGKNDQGVIKRYRLADVYAAEMGAIGGIIAKHALSNYIDDKTVRVDYVGTWGLGLVEAPVYEMTYERYVVEVILYPGILILQRNVNDLMREKCAGTEQPPRRQFYS